MNKQIVEKVRAGKQTFGPGASGEGDVGARKQPPNLTQGGDGHHGIANPVGAADDDALDVVRPRFSHGSDLWSLAFGLRSLHSPGEPVQPSRKTQRPKT